MKKKVELPLVEPIYKTYHNAIFSACIKENPSIRNYYLNECFILECDRRFLFGFTTPTVNVLGCSAFDNPYLEKQWFYMKYLKGHINSVIRNLIDDGYYIYFSSIDDYYVEGKTWYKERHFNHNGAICGYNQEDKTYCIYAYDKNWIHQKFWTSQYGFNRGRKSTDKQGAPGAICATKPKSKIVEFSPKKACKKIIEYLDSNLEKYPPDNDGKVYGIAVQDYVAKYVEMLFQNKIPYDRMDRRIFSIIWEQKKVLHETIQCIEKELYLDSDISGKYKLIVDEANTMRMLYASHRMRRRDSVLPVIQKKLLKVKEQEQELLNELLKKAEVKDGTLELYKKTHA